MALYIRQDGDVTILSNFGRLMNDPKYVDAVRDVDEQIDEGGRKFVMELAGVHETGASFLGVLMTLTRTIRRRGGEVVIVRPSPQIEAFLAAMQMDDYWDVFRTTDEAKRFFGRRDAE
jgi:anti-sigma B factor antagonist